MNNTNACANNAAAKLIFACSGAADVGAIADQAARKLTRDGHGKMFCLAGVGGRVPPIIERTQSAERVLAIDGCELDCVKKCLELAGFPDADHVRLSDLGFEKGKSPVTNEAVDRVAACAAEILAAR
ncbi:MAG: putative zinc-binding protein [Candidatus Hydrogenedentes bacterium]|nr:putative zinc-binding protein [Candidatus Hydrogenedentota bacterium]